MSTATLDALVIRLEAEGARRFARWNTEVYRAFCAGSAGWDGDEGPAVTLWDNLHREEGKEAVFEAFLRLAVEGIGLEHIDRADLEGRHRNLLGLLFADRLPELLADTDGAEERLARLAEAWNLGEGLLSQPAWLNCYAASALAGLSSLEALDEQLVAVLEPALATRSPASFEGPFAVSTLDTSEVEGSFLPGDMHFTAPAVLCVHDRKRPGVQTGVLLRSGGASSLLSLTPCPGAAPEETGLPAVKLTENTVCVGTCKVPVSFLRRGHGAAVSSAGFVVASAVDSQRLWVVETP